jgi:hypothetical protein
MMKQYLKRGVIEVQGISLVSSKAAFEHSLTSNFRLHLIIIKELCMAQLTNKHT